MIRFICALATTLGTAYAIPLELEHEGRLLDTDGSGINSSETLTFTLYTDAGGTNDVWSDSFPLDLQDGYYTVVLGSGLVPLSATTFDQDGLYLGVARATGGDLLPRPRLRPTPFALRARSADTLTAGAVLQIGDDGNATCDATRAGVLRYTTADGLQVCDPPNSWRTLTTAGVGTQAAPATSCKAILDADSNAQTGLYWIDPSGSHPVEVLCDMDTDGGGFTMCARQNFSTSGQYLGNTYLSSEVGTVTESGIRWATDCAQLMRDVAPAPGAAVEFMMIGSTAGEWMWVYPWYVERFEDLLLGTTNASGGPSTCTNLPVTQCKGSQTGANTVSVTKNFACHSYDGHRTGDSYFIFQVADSQNTNVLLEIGQGDANHPVQIRPDCDGSGFTGSCARPSGSYPYQTSSVCGSGREYGTVTVGFRER